MYYIYVDSKNNLSVAASDNPSRDFKNLVGELPEGEQLPWLDVDVEAKTISINQERKAQVLDKIRLAQAAEAKERAEKIKKVQERQKLKDLDVDNLKDLAEIKAVLKSLVMILKEEKADSVQPSNAVEARIIIGGKRK